MSDLSYQKPDEKKGVYIHIPFCVKKCIYCDFYSVTDLSLIDEYIKALTKEIGLRSRKGEKKLQEKPFGELQNKVPDSKCLPGIDTIYFGGGTPSLLNAGQIEHILNAVQVHFAVRENPEVSFEINPGTIDEHYLTQIRKIGINRLSIGIQSFDDRKLGFLKRIHSAGQAEKSIYYARKAGFDNISLDMMYGLHFETRSTLEQDLDRAVLENPEHMSCYMLSVEPLTPLDEQVRAGRAEVMENDALMRLFKHSSSYLGSRGYEHYEISNFSKDKSLRSRHNSKYWRRIPYFGFGAGAHSFDGEKRSWNEKNVQNYVKKIKVGKLPVEETESLSLKQKKLETIMLGLRTVEGINLKQYKIEFKTDFTREFEEILQNVLNDSCAVLNSDTFSLNMRGMVRLDSITKEFPDILFPA